MLGLTAVFGRWAGSCAVVAIIRTILVTACGALTGAGFGGRQPGISSDNELVKSQSRDGDPDFAAYYKERRKLSLTRNSTWFISTAKVSADLF